MRTLMSLLIAAVCAQICVAQTIELVDEVVLPGGGERTFTFTAPEVPDGKIAVVHFRGRLQNERQAGHTAGVRVYVNGRELHGDRIVNKPQELEWGGNVALWWSGGFRLMYSPDFEGNNQPDNPYYISTGQAYTFDLDITDLLQPGENTLRLTHAQRNPDFPREAIIVDLRVQVIEPAAGEQVQVGPPTGPLPFIAPEVDHHVDYQVNCTPGGGLAVTVGGRTYGITSEFSHERGGWNTLSAAGDAAGEDGWAPRVRAVEDGFVVEATAADYTLERRVLLHDEYISVEDTVTNTSGRDIALLQRHLADVGDAEEIYLAGVRPPSKTGQIREPANPTVLAIHEGSQIGLTPNDDVLRVHAYVYAKDGRAGILDLDGALAAGAAETYRWEIYPSATTGYFEMVNAIRRAHDVNFEIPGGFCFLEPREPFLSMSDEELGAWLDAKNARIVGISITVPRYHGKLTHGTAFLLVDHTIKREFAERIRRIRPGTKVLVYFHCYISTEDEAPEKYAAERLLRPDGTQAVYSLDIYPLFLPLPGSDYARAMREFVRIILEDIGADGVYWDEIEYSRFAYHYGEPWDGRSADVDADTLTITRKKSSVTLITQPFRFPLAQEILDRSMMIGNGAPHTATMAQLHFPRFIETGSISNLRRGHLYTPIGLGDHLSERSTQDCIAGMRRHLSYGSLYYFYHSQVTADYPSITEHMFPCTPIELHRGYILAQERILTNTSGNFGWGDTSDFEVHVYGPDGREIPDFEAPIIEHDGARYVELRLPRDYMAAIVRR